MARCTLPGAAEHGNTLQDTCCGAQFWFAGFFFAFTGDVPSVLCDIFINSVFLTSFAEMFFQLLSGIRSRVPNAVVLSCATPGYVRMARVEDHVSGSQGCSLVSQGCACT